ncbi:lipid II flippase MurJ [Pseudonocardia bannensis]|uniref:Peptidoglycan lipid II flippase n=1 Tax=Pseudonocardia bannensis TaxID=630973 RepID=A0A848DEY3_9PSEU|nr:lipid II flippase MurJ [Pseudonocardia bannensis]NMH91135.1 hypothetical protein [Pseudonocardia bannensis]
MLKPMRRSSLPVGRERGPARNSASVAAWTLVSRTTGLARVVVIGAVLGPTYFANVFASTNVTPTLIFSALGGSAVAMVLVPALVRAVSDRGVAGAAGTMGKVTGYLLGVSAALAALLVVASPGLAWAMTLGVDTDRSRAYLLCLIMLISVAAQVVLYTLAAIGAAVQQARHRFALAAAAPALENIGLIATMIVAALLFRPGPEVDEVPLGLVVTLGLGSTIAVGLHAAAQLAGAAAAGLPVRPMRGWSADPHAAEVAARLRRSVGVTAFPCASYFMLVLLAATVPGGVLVLQISWAIYQLPTALGARAVSAAVLPGLASAAEHGDAAGFASSWRRALTYVAIASLPPLCMLVVFAESIANILANGELRSTALTTSLVACIMVLGVSQLAAGVQEVGRQALFARLDLRGPQQASVVSVVTTAVVGSCALLLPTGAPRLVGICLAVLAADAVATGVVLVMLRNRLRPDAIADHRQLGAAFVATIAMLPAVVLGRSVVDHTTSGRVGELVIVVVAATIGLTTFVLTIRALWRRIGATP